MGIFGGAKKPPAPIPPPPPPAPAVTAATQAQAGVAERQAAASAQGAGFDDTVKNTGGAQGLQEQNTPTAQKQLTGQ